MPAQGQNLIYESGQWQIDVGRRELLSGGTVVPIGARAFEIIEVLVRSANELVSKDDLLNRIWPGAIVGENTLQVHISAIRKAFGRDRAMLSTAPGRGYRLLGDWTVRHDTARPPKGPQRIAVGGEAPPTNFPAAVTRLVGRAAAIALLRDLMSAYRMVTLTGPGGIGKSTLGLKVARRIVGEFPDGGWLVELVSLSDPALVPATVAGVLGLRLGSNNIVAESVAHAIGDRKLLLVLDNCEHLIGAVASLAEALLARCPNITIQATTREMLRIHGEQVYRVPSLEVPATDHMEASRILEHSAPALFIARARELGCDFSSNTEIAMIAAICRHLDGIPLGIELAAARTATLGLDLIAARLGERFALLTTGRRTALPRHQTLRATLDWSYRLLSDAERKLLDCLAIFAGAFSLEAVGAVAAAGMDAGEIADGIADLVGKSLVIRTADPGSSGFRLLETTRVYARDRLAESGALPEVARRHAAYCLAALGTIDDERRSQPTEVHLAAFRRCADELHVALEWAFSAAGDPAIGLALTLAAVPLWFALSQMAAARGRVGQALPHAAAGSDVEMRLRLALGHALWYTTPESDALEAAFARALEIAERIGATEAQIQALWGLWAARRSRGDYAAALEIARSYAQAAANAGDAGAIHLGDRILGLTHHFMGHQAIAREFAERSLRRPHLADPASGIGFQVETPAAMGSLLARILWLSGFPEQAAVAASDAVATAAKSGHSFSVCYAVCLAGLPVALWTGDMGEARRLLDLFIAHAGGIRRMEHRVPAFARLLKLRAGDEAEMLTASFIESDRDPALIPPFADVDANAHIGVPLPRAEPAETTWNTAELLRVDAELLLWHAAPGAVAAAEAKLLRALEIARGQQALSWELRGAISLARLWRDHGRAADALNLLAATYGKFTEGFGTSDLVHARGLMADIGRDRPPR